MQTIKGLTLGPWNEKQRTHSTWYEPLTEQADVDLAVRYVLGRPGLFLNSAGDVTLLPKILDAADRGGSAPSDGDVERLISGRAMTPLFV